MKYYFLFFFVFCFLIGGGVYALNSESITLNLFGYNFSLPLSLWILGSITIFFVFSLFFFANHWIEKMLSTYRFEKDFNLLVDQIYAQILQEEIPHAHFRTELCKLHSQILRRLNFSINLASEPSQNPKIDQLLTELENLEKGEVCKKTFKSAKLQNQNLLNKINLDSKFAQKVLDGHYELPLKQQAVLVLLEKNLFNEKMLPKIEQIYMDNTQEVLEKILNQGYKLSIQDFLKLLLKVPHEQYLYFAQKFKTFFDPDFCIKLFSELALQNPQARNAYVYILLDYSMFDEARTFLKDNEDLILPLAYLQLKDQNKTYSLESFF